MRAPRSAVVLAAVALALAACDGDPDDDPDGLEDLDDEDLDALEEGAPDELGATAPPQVELVDAGDEPREALRLEAEEGDEIEATLVVEQELLGGETGGEEIPAEPARPIGLHLTLVVEEVDGGETTVIYTYDGIDVDLGPPVGPRQEPEEQPLADLEGISGRLVLDERARVVETSVDAEGMDPQMAQFVDMFQQQLTALPTPLPEEEVGEGASWRVVTEDALGLPATETITTRLVSRDDAEFVVEVAVDTAAEPGAPLQDMQQPMEMTLEELTREGEGTTEGTLAEAFPRSARLEIRTAVAVSASDELDDESLPQTGGDQSQRFRELMTFERR